MTKYSPLLSILRFFKRFMLSYIKLTAVMTVITLGFSACSGFLAKPGDQPDLVNPPKLFKNSSGDLEWERVSAFGPVPIDIQVRGNVICQTLGKDIIATGYNPEALDPNGKTLPGGGFYCTRM